MRHIHETSYVPVINGFVLLLSACEVHYAGICLRDFTKKWCYSIAGTNLCRNTRTSFIFCVEMYGLSVLKILLTHTYNTHTHRRTHAMKASES